MNRYPAYISKPNSNFENLSLLMIPNGERSHYLTVVVQKAMVVFIVWLVFLCLEQKTNVNLKKDM